LSSLKKYVQTIATITLLIFSFIAVVTVALVYPSGIAHTKEVNSEIVIGIVTVSGLIFAFQPTIFKIKKIGFYRILFLAIFSLEGLLLGIVGYNFNANAQNLGYLTEDSLFLATASLFFNLVMSAYFVVLDLLMQSEEETNVKMRTSKDKANNDYVT
jgi:hypothetical protein